MKPCAKCPWTEPPETSPVGDRERTAAREGAWFCCHVNMGTCFGAEAFAKREQRSIAPSGAK